jgi:hypothetical protein
VNTPAVIALLAAIGLASHAQSTELGRLFFSPIERKQLDRQAFKEREHDTPSVITVNGIIKRSDGSRIAWINGKAQEIGSHTDPNVVTLTLSGKDQPIEATVGQPIILDSPLQDRAETP